jgi:hypothetical protein
MIGSSRVSRAKAVFLSGKSRYIELIVRSSEHPSAAKMYRAIVHAGVHTRVSNVEVLGSEYVNTHTFDADIRVMLSCFSKYQQAG